MNLFTKITFRNFALSVLSAAVLSACGGAGSCTNCSTPTPTPSPGTLSLSIEAPSQYPAGLPVSIDASLTMTNTSSVDASNLVYTIPAPNEPGNYTKVVITPNAGVGSASGDCTNIAAGASCTFVATISAYASPGSFTVTATPNSTATAKTTQSGKSSQADSISVTANLGLVDIPNTNNEYYILPSDQTIQGSTTQATTAYVSVLVKKVSSGLSSFKLVNELGEELTYTAIGTPKYTVNSVNSYKVTIPAGQTLQHVQVLSNVCTTLNNGTNNDTACSNDADINLAQAGVGILAIQPNYFQMTESVTSQVITLQNIGTANITNLQLPTIAAPFKIIDNSCANVSTLTPLSSCLITIGYTVGSTSGQGSYVVNYNNGNGAANTAATIPYIGTSTAPFAIITASPTSFSLSTSNTRQRITLTNTGTAAATTFTFPTLTAPLTESTTTTTCTSNLGVGASCFYDVYIDYTQNVTAGSSTLAFGYNNGQAAQTINVAADWSAYTVPMANLVLSSSTVDLNPTYEQRTVTVTNSGTASATNLVLPTLSAPTYFYENTSTCTAGMTLAPQASCTYTISYSGATTASSSNVTFGYTGGTVSTIPLTINWVQATQWAYVVRKDSNNTGVYKCTLDADGDISNCVQQANSMNVVRGRDLTFNVVDEVKYLYVADYQAGGIFKCTLSAIGDINTCTNITASTPAAGIEAGYIVFGTINNTQYAYFTDTNNQDLFTCKVKSDGDFEDCSSTDFSYIYGITFINISGSPYLYVNGDINSSTGLIRIPLNTTNGQPIENDLQVLLNYGNYDSGLDIYKFNGIRYLYTGYTGPVGSSWTLSVNGAAVSNQVDFENITNLPYSINFTTATDMSPYGYVQSTGGIYQCNVNQSTGALTGCANTTAAMGVSIAFSLFTPPCNPCTIFTTAATTANGNLGASWNEIDNICMTDSNKPDDGLEYKAMLVGTNNGVLRQACVSPNCTTGGTTENFNWVLHPDTRYNWANSTNQVFTTNGTGIAPMPIVNQGAPSSAVAWTGFNVSQDWTTDPSNTCGGWTSTSGNGRMGNRASANGNFIAAVTRACSDARQLLYCVSQ